MAVDRKTIIKIALVVLVVFLVYKYIQHNKNDKRRKSEESYVPFDEMPFDTIPPSSTAEPGVPPMNLATDLLPKPSTPQVMDFGEFAPKALDGQNFLSFTNQIGIDTKGASMKNPNLQLRADIPNPRGNVGPWMNSTIEADLYRKPLE